MQKIGNKLFYNEDGLALIASVPPPGGQPLVYPGVFYDQYVIIDHEDEYADIYKRNIQTGLYDIPVYIGDDDKVKLYVYGKSTYIDMITVEEEHEIGYNKLINIMNKDINRIKRERFNND